ncbi:hypothetical protein BH18ACT1_BH18ACT1_07090 [soil metagenome]
MTAVWWRTRAELRRRWAPTLLLVLLVGVVGSGVLSAVAGARRTSSAPERLVAATGAAYETLVYDVGEADAAQVTALPQVASSATITFLLVDGVDPPGTLTAFATSDPLVGAQVVEGAPFDLRDPLIAAIDRPAARRFDLEVGDELVLGAYSPEQAERFDIVGGPMGRRFPVRVGAIVREPNDISPDDPSAEDQVAYASNANVYLPSAFLERFGEEVTTINTLSGFKLRGGEAAVDGFVADVRDLPGGDTVQFFDEPPVDPDTQRSVDVQALALVFFGAALGLDGAVNIGLALSRQLRAASADDEHLRALGMRSSQRIGVGAAQGAVVGGPGALLAVLGAIALSPLSPVGLSREVEPAPGLDADLVVLGAGALAVVVLTVGWTALAGWSIERRRRRQATAYRSRALPERAARAGAPAPLVVGLALSGGRRRSGGSTPRALAGVAVGVASVVAAATFVATLDGLVDDPERFGWTFDAVVGSPFAGDAYEIERALAGAHGVQATARSGSTAVQVGDVEFGLIGVEAGRGIAVAAVESGREPLGAGEIALGRRTLRAVGKEVGDTLRLEAAAGPVDLTITGAAVVPEIGSVGTGFGEGGVVTLETFSEVVPDAPPSILVLDIATGASPETIEALRERSGGLLLQPVLPSSLYEVQRVRSLPILLAALFAVLALVALAHTLVTLVRARRHDVAILKTIGFVPRQVRAATLWLASAFVAVAVVVGLPLGVVLGRSVWAWNAGRLGVESHPVVPVLVLVALVPAAVVVGNLAAAVPGWLAARTRVVHTLRTT